LNYFHYDPAHFNYIKPENCFFLREFHIVEMSEANNSGKLALSVEFLEVKKNGCFKNDSHNGAVGGSCHISSDGIYSDSNWSMAGCDAGRSRNTASGSSQQNISR
jgi:hypothetical protein